MVKGEALRASQGQSRAENCQGPHDTILSQNVGADTICVAIFTILYILQFNTVILLQFNVPNILLTICLLQRNKRESHDKVQSWK